MKPTIQVFNADFTPEQLQKFRESFERCYGGDASATHKFRTPILREGTMELVKYKNRKLYDRNESCYVTLTDVVAAVQKNTPVRVLENGTNKDITRDVLVEAALRHNNLDEAALLGIIKGGNA